MPIDVNKWLAEQAAALGLGESEKAAVAKLVGNPAFRSTFVPVSDFHSALDQQKSKYQEKLNEVVDLNNQWQDAYEREYKPALSAMEKLQGAGYDVNGFRNDGRGGVVNNQGQQFTLEDVQKMIANAVEPVRAGAIDYGTFIADVSVSYRDEYGKRFDAAKFRQFAYENSEKYPTFESAYNAYTEEDRKVKAVKEQEDWRTAEREKMRIELMSNANLPEAAGTEGSPLFVANAQVDPASNDTAARQSFAKILNSGDLGSLIK